MIRGAYDSSQTAATVRERDKRLYYAAKRVMDVALALLALALLSPLMLLIALAIRLDSPGPILFVQKRAGSKRMRRWAATTAGSTVWEVTEFPFYKFRSMVINADSSIHEAYIKAWASGELEVGTISGGQNPKDSEHASKDAGPKFKLKGDKRITRVGEILRRTSLDELPQLFNILQGEMSLVGPRPVPPYEVALYKDWYFQRFEALPGLTGWWQVKGRGRVTLEEMIQMDLDYIHNQSLWLDIKILLHTFPAVLAGEGAR